MSIPTLAEEYHSIVDMGENEEKFELSEIIFKRKPKENIRNQIRWVTNLKVTDKTAG